jgi:hypothetical protein
VNEGSTERIKQIGEALAALVDFVPSSKFELKDWYDQAQQFKDDHIIYPNKGVPHFLWHYLSDADIRMKDEKYAEMQDGRIKVLLQYLNNGIMPTDDDV